LRNFGGLWDVMMSSNPILFITGGNAGLGFESIRSLCQSSRAYTILLGGRDIEKAKNAAKALETEIPNSLSTVETVQIDIEDDDSISKAFEHISSKYDRLDILINNAGASFDGQMYDGTSKMSMREMWNKSWDVNTTGTHIVTYTFAPLLLKSSEPRLIFITSGTSPLAETENTTSWLNKSPAKGWPKEVMAPLAAYRSSKCGMNMLMREWYRILREDGVKVLAVSPGYLATGLGGSQERNKKMGAEDPVLGANFVRDVVEGARDADVGKIVRRGGLVQPW